MSEEIKYDLAFILLGGLTLILGISIKKSDLPSMISRKYVIIILGGIFIIYGGISFIVDFKR
jgi:hypothetical protein